MPQMKKISVEELKPGMRFNRPAYIDSENMFIGANIAIEEQDIKKLMRWGILEIETTGELIDSREESGEQREPQPPQANPVPFDAEQIIDDYNALLKKRHFLIEIHKKACQAVEQLHAQIKNDEPFDLKLIENSLKHIIKVLEENRNIVLFLYGLDEGKNYLVAHSVNVTFYAVLIGMGLQYSRYKLRELGIGTLLIDAGMLKMPAYIAHKQSNLSEQEYNKIKTHTLIGYRILKEKGQIDEKIATVSLQHHERFDGKGYPRGLKGTQIDEFARIAAIADSYEAQISNRSYRKKHFFYHAMRNLMSTGVSRFDPVIMRVFLSQMSVYPVGSIVELNDGNIGLVVGSVPEKPLRPIVKLIFDQRGNRINDRVIINLLAETGRYIVKALDDEEAGVNFLDVL